MAMLLHNKEMKAQSQPDDGDIWDGSGINFVPIDTAEEIKINQRQRWLRDAVIKNLKSNHYHCLTQGKYSWLLGLLVLGNQPLFRPSVQNFKQEELMSSKQPSTT